jgi:hypothetical protein
MPTKSEIAEFSEMIEILSQDTGLTRMDAIVYHCETIGLEVDLAASLISPALKAKIREEAEDLNLMKKSSKLPL